MNTQIPVEAMAAGSPAHGTRIKVLDPLTSIGPSMEAELLSSSDSDYQLRVPRWILPGSVVQVLTANGVVMGKVWFAAQVRGGFEVEVAVEPLPLLVARH
jgi:hypothetical protein